MAPAVWTGPRLRMLGLCYLSYFASIFHRTSISIVLPPLQADPTVALSHATISLLLSSSSAVYCVGKLISGALCDRIGPRTTLVSSLAACSGSYVLASITTKAQARMWPLFVSVWVSYFWTTACWPAMGKCAQAWFEGELFGSAWAVLTTASRFAAGVGSLVLGTMLGRVSWRVVLRFVAVFAAAVAGVLALWLRDRPPPEAVGSGAKAARKEEGGKEEESAVPPLVVCAHALRDRRFLLCMAHQCCILPLIDAFGALVPMFFTESIGLSAAAAGRAAAVFPAGAVLSCLAGGKILHWLRPHSRVPFVTGLMAAAVAAFGLLSAMRRPSVGRACAALFVAMVGVALSFYHGP